MKQYFKEQLKKSIPITYEKLELMYNHRLSSSKQSPKSFFGSLCEIGDVMIFFIEQKIHEKNEIKMFIRAILERDLDILKENWEYIEHRIDIPILRRKDESIS